MSGYLRNLVQRSAGLATETPAAAVVDPAAPLAVGPDESATLTLLDGTVDEVPVTPQWVPADERSPEQPRRSAVDHAEREDVPPIVGLVTTRHEATIEVVADEAVRGDRLPREPLSLEPRTEHHSPTARAEEITPAPLRTAPRVEPEAARPNPNPASAVHPVATIAEPAVPPSKSDVHARSPLIGEPARPGERSDVEPRRPRRDEARPSTVPPPKIAAASDAEGRAPSPLPLPRVVPAEDMTPTVRPTPTRATPAPQHPPTSVPPAEQTREVRVVKIEEPARPAASSPSISRPGIIGFDRYVSLRTYARRTF